MRNLVGLLLAVVLAAGAATLVTPHPSAATPNFGRLLWRYLLAVLGFFFPFALPLILDANGQGFAHIHFQVPELRYA